MKEKVNEDKFSPLFQGNFGRTVSKQYGLFYQNKSTNQLSEISTKRNPTKALPYMNAARLKYKDLTVDIDNKVKVGPAETMMLDYIIFRHTQDDNHENELSVVIPLKEYMRDRGLKDPKSARTFLKKEKDILPSIHVSYDSKDDDNPLDVSYRVNLFSSGAWVSGKAIFNLTPEFNSQLTQHGRAMPYFKGLFKLNPYKGESAIRIGKWLQRNKFLNYGKPRADFAKISTLLSNCPSIRSYDEVMKHGKHVNQLIIQPFLDAVEQLAQQGMFTYRLCYDKEGKKEFNYTNGLAYEDFIKGYLIITSWNDYLEEYARIIAEKRNKYRKMALKRKKHKKK